MQASRPAKTTSPEIRPVPALHRWKTPPRPRPRPRRRRAEPRGRRREGRASSPLPAPRPRRRDACGVHPSPLPRHHRAHDRIVPAPPHRRRREGGSSRPGSARQPASAQGSGPRSRRRGGRRRPPAARTAREGLIAPRLGSVTSAWSKAPRRDDRAGTCGRSRPCSRRRHALSERAKKRADRRGRANVRAPRGLQAWTRSGSSAAID